MTFKKTFLLILAFVFSVHPCMHSLEADYSSEQCNKYTFYADLLGWRLFDDQQACGGEKQKDLWNLGYRLGVEYNLCQNWDLIASWTHFKIDSHRQCSKLDFEYNNADLLIGSNYCVADCLLLRPAFGLRYSRIKDRHSSRGWENFSCSSDHEDIFTKKKINEHFEGVGPELNLEVNWLLGCDFNIFASVGASVLYGCHSQRENLIEQFFDPEETFFCCDGCRKGVCIGVFDAALGLGWEKCFCSGQILSLRLAWEHHRYLRFHRLAHGDLSLDGVSFSAKVAF